MAKGLKTRGIADLQDVKKRAIRQHALERISPQDRDEIVSGINRLIAKIVRMDEVDPEEDQQW